MSNTDLMIKRVKVILDYPDSRFGVGEILEVHQDGARLVNPKTGWSIDWFKYKRWPHIFKEIPWWEDRKEDEMPEYVKHMNGTVYRVNKWLWSPTFGGTWYSQEDKSIWVSAVFPITEQEYLIHKPHYL